MSNAIFNLKKQDVDKYIQQKGIEDCSLCQHKKTMTPVYDDDMKVIYRAVNFLKFNDLTGSLTQEMESFEVMITCEHCGVIHAIAPTDILNVVEQE